jgi:hypothetical protein
VVIAKQLINIKNNMNCKLTINLNTGHLEVEGNEELVKEIYRDFRSMMEKVSPPNQDKEDLSGFYTDRPIEGEIKQPSKTVLLTWA